MTKRFTRKAFQPVTWQEAAAGDAFRSKSTGSNQNGLKRRIASRHIQNAECFRIPKNPKICVSVAITNALFTKRIAP
jgi:hypothetical protein